MIDDDLDDIAGDEDNDSDDDIDDDIDDGVAGSGGNCVSDGKRLSVGRASGAVWPIEAELPDGDRDKERVSTTNTSLSPAPIMAPDLI